MKQTPLACALAILMAACNTSPNKPEMKVTEISFYYIPEVNLGVGVYSNETEQTVRVFVDPDGVTEERDGYVAFHRSTGITFRKDARMELSLTDYFRFPEILLLSGYDDATLIEVKPQWSYVVLGKTTQTFPDGVRFVNVPLPVRKDLLEYVDSAGQRRETLADY